jgi:hypothetical protein
VSQLSLEDIVLAYMEKPAGDRGAARQAAVEVLR